MPLTERLPEGSGELLEKEGEMYKATGYFKVTATLHGDVSDEDTLLGPRAPLPPRRTIDRQHGGDPDQRRVASWVYPFNALDPMTVDLASDKARAKLLELMGRLPEEDRQRLRLTKVARDGETTGWSPITAALTATFT